MTISGRVTAGSLPDCWASTAACVSSSISLCLSASISVLASWSESEFLGLCLNYSTKVVEMGNL